MGSFLADRWNEKPSPPKQVTVNEFSEHGLSDKPKREKKKPDHSAENEVKRLNKRLESINAPFYAVCKDDGTIGYRKVKPSCDPEHPNVTYSRKKVVDAVLKEEEKEEKKKEKKEEKKEEKPAEKPSEKQDKPKKEPKEEPKPAEKEPKKSSDDDDLDAKSAKILEMIEAKFNKILESKG